MGFRIPPELIVLFDIYHLPDDQDVFLTYKKLHDGPPLVWTNRNGGHWIATRAKLIQEVLTDPQRFSSRSVFIPVNFWRPKMVPMEIDPPEHRPYRKILDRIFEQEALDSWEPQIRTLSQELLGGFASQGSCEFMEDFARKLPVNFLLNLLGVLDDRDKLVRLVSTSVRPDALYQVEQKIDEMILYLEKLIKKRRQNPGTDLLSRCLEFELTEGRKLTDDEALTFFWSLIGGSLDTTSACLGWAAHFLAQNPAHVKELRENPALIDPAVDELFRRFSVSNPSRIVTRDMEFHGVKLTAGDAILSPGCLYNLDEELFENPLEVNFHRKNLSESAPFSLGIHICPARNVARRMMKVFLEEWLRMIPEFSLNGLPTTKAGLVSSVTSLPLRWVP